MIINNDLFIIKRFGTIFSVPTQLVILYLEYMEITNPRYNHFSTTTNFILLVSAFVFYFFIIKSYYPNNKLLFLVLFLFSINFIQNLFISGYLYHFILQGFNNWVLNILTLLIVLFWGIFFDYAKNKSELQSQK